MNLKSRYSLVVGLVFTWSLIGFPFIAAVSNTLGQSSTAIVIFMRALVASICLAMIFVGLLSRRSPQSFAYILFLAFFAAYATRIGFDTAFYPHFLARPAYVYWMFAIGVCFVPAMMLAMFSRDLDIERLYWILISISVGVLVLAIASGDTTMHTEAGGSIDTGRLGLQSLNPISLGHVAATTLILVYWKIRILSTASKGLLLNLGSVALGVYVILATGSRGPLVALILAVLFFEAVKGGKAVIILFICTMPFLASLTLDLTEIEAVFGTKLFSRIDEAITLTDVSSQGRLVQISSAWALFREAPLLGAALEDPAFGIYPHNIVVESFMALGIFGGLLCILLLTLCSIKSFLIARRNTVMSIYGALFVQYLVGAQLSGSLYTSSVLWGLLACICGFAIPSANLARDRSDRLHNQNNRKWREVRPVY